MAITPKKVDFSTINEVVNGGGISPEHINAPLQASAYAQELAKNQPDISEANGSGDASVEIIETNGKPQFKFKNIKGASGNVIVAKNSETAPEELPSIATGRQINSQVGAPNVGNACIMQYTNANSKGQISVYGIIDTIVVSNIVSIAPIGWFNGASGSGSGTITPEDLPTMVNFSYGDMNYADEVIIEDGGIKATFNTSSEIEYEDKDGNVSYKNPSIVTKIPIEAGKNIEFENDGSSVVIHASVPNDVSNPNILINSNFAINQRGETSYTYDNTKKYTVDRWFIFAGTLTVNDDGTVSHTKTWSSEQGIAQIIEKPSRFAGKTLFVSCKILAEQFGYSLALRLYKNGETTYQTLGSYGASGGNIFIPTDITDEDTLAFYILNRNTNSTIKIYWVKLEESESATPYTTPDLALELMRCQRYFVRLNGHTLISFSQLDSVYTSMPENVLSAYTGKFIVNLPSTMRIIPTLVSDNVKILHKGVLRNIVSLAIGYKYDYMPHQIVLEVKASPENISQYDFAHLAIYTNGYIDLDAELYK